MANRPLKSYIREIERVIGSRETIYLDEVYAKKLKSILAQMEEHFGEVLKYRNDEITLGERKETHMNELESKIINTYKNAVEFYNMMMDSDTTYSDDTIKGMEQMAEVFGYVLYAHHKNDIISFKYDYITLAKDGNILVEIQI